MFTDLCRRSAAWLPTGGSKARISPHAHCSLNSVCHRRYIFEIRTDQVRVSGHRVQTQNIIGPHLRRGASGVSNRSAMSTPPIC